MTIIVLHPRTDTQKTAAKMFIHWKKNGILIFCTNVSRGNFVLRLQEAVFSAWKLRALDCSYVSCQFNMILFHIKSVHALNT
jgi:hypothetical protein